MINEITISYFTYYVKSRLDLIKLAKLGLLHRFNYFKFNLLIKYINKKRCILSNYKVELAFF